MEFPGEIVTKALLRYRDLPGDAGRFALITLDNGHDSTKPNTFGPAGLASLASALEEVERHTASSGIVGVGLTGKSFGFSAGADLKGMARLTSRDQALDIGRLGHAVFRRLGELAVPSFAFINGTALGGGLEIALHCGYRTISAGVSRVALPECFLGLVPGWGGTQLLPALIGPDAAVTVMIENPLHANRMLTGAQAYQLGIADALFDAADFLEQSLAWAGQIIAGKITVSRRQADPDEAWQMALARGKATADAKTHGAAPAPYRALELIKLARGASRDAGFAAEDAALADLLLSEELRSSLYAFNLVQKRAKHPVGAPDEALARPIAKVGIVGAGLMARQIALLCVQQLQAPVVLTDLDQERVAAGVAHIRAEIDKLVSTNRLSPDAAHRLNALIGGSVTTAAFADADMVIEAVFEEMAIKQQVFRELEAIVPSSCVLATNTSSLSVTEIAAGLDHPERVVGLHFFNPVAVMRLVEVVRAEQTDDATLATACAAGKQLRKSCVLVNDAAAFVVNRLLTRMLSEVTRAVDDGAPIDVADAALAPLGLPMSPFALLKLIGPAVALHVTETLHRAFPDRFYVSDNLRQLAMDGNTTGYPPSGESRDVDPATAWTAEQIRQQVVEALAQETRLMLDDGVVAEAADVDLCMILGAGWPFHLGGITPYLDRTGIATKVTGARFQPAGIASLP